MGVIATKALDGIRVVDMTLHVAGPDAAAMLADLGAEVIHVEEPVRGDVLRGVVRVYGQPLGLPAGRNLYFEIANRNKKSIGVDLKSSEGRDVLRRLVEKSDVFVSNMRGNALQRLGLDEASVKRWNRRVIYAHFSGFGERGEDSNTPSMDLLGLARSGLMMGSGEEGDPPTNLAIGVSDRVSGMCLAYGIVVALLARERLGVGQSVYTSHLQSSLSLGTYSIGPALLGREMPRFNRSRPRNPICNYYACRDGNWIAICCFWEWHMRFPPYPAQLTETPAAVTEPAPELGQHTEEVLNEVIGYSWDEIARLREAGVI